MCFSVFHNKMRILLKLLRVIFFICTVQGYPSMYLNRESADTDPISGFRGQLSRLRFNPDIIVMQRKGDESTTYHLADEPRSHPIFSRGLQELGKKYIIFGHPSFPAGSGHYIVFKRMEHQRAKYQGNTNFLYECYVLNFKDTLHGTVSDLDPQLYKFYQDRIGFNHGYRQFGK